MNSQQAASGAQPADAGIGSWSGERTARFRDGSWGVRARDRSAVAAWAIDVSIVLLFSAVAGVLAGMPSYSAGTGVTVGILSWFFFPWLYGFFCIGGNTLGTLVAGTRLVKLRDGSAPGFWRNGWLMFLRVVLFVLMPINALLGALNGDSSAMEPERKHHVSIDTAATKVLHPGNITPV